MIIRALLSALAIAGCQLAQQSNPAPPRYGSGRDPGLFKGEKPKKGDENVRSLTGMVRDNNDQPVEGAIVQIKDTKSLKVRSFITQADGQYRFNSLSSDVDYEVKARFKDTESELKTLSLYDGRKQAVINLKVMSKKDREKEKSEQ
jgi:hypothetical protein